MINIVDKNIFDSTANFIVHQVSYQGAMGTGLANQITNKYPHVEQEYLKYLRYCKKNNINPLGTAQYIPVDTWALVMVNTMKNSDVMEYDLKYQYIVNLFSQDAVGNDEQQTDLKAMEKAFADIYEKAKKIGASVAMPYKIGSYHGGANWNYHCRNGVNWDDVYAVIQKVFQNDVDVEICKCSK